MKPTLRDEIAERLYEEILRDVGEQERGALEMLLDDLVEAEKLTRSEALEIESTAGLVATVTTEAAFVAGFELGIQPRALLVK